MGDVSTSVPAAAPTGAASAFRTPTAAAAARFVPPGGPEHLRVLHLPARSRAGRGLPMVSLFQGRADAADAKPNRRGHVNPSDGVQGTISFQSSAL